MLNKKLSMEKSLCFITVLLFLALNFFHFIYRCVDSYLDAYSLANNFLICIVTSYIIYLVVVYIPEQKRKNIIKNQLKKRYAYSKERIMNILISSLDVQNCQLFDFNSCEAWRLFWEKYHYSVMNGLEGDNNKIDVILCELSSLKDEVSFVLYKLDIANAELFDQLKLLQEVINDYGKCENGTDDLKFMIRFLTRTFSACDAISGKHGNEDHISRIIDQI